MGMARGLVSYKQILVEQLGGMATTRKSKAKHQLLPRWKFGAQKLHHKTIARGPRVGEFQGPNQFGCCIGICSKETITRLLYVASLVILAAIPAFLLVTTTYKTFASIVHNAPSVIQMARPQNE